MKLSYRPYLKAAPSKYKSHEQFEHVTKRHGSLSTKDTRKKIESI